MSEINIPAQGQVQTDASQTPAQGQAQIENAIPYHRFKEVNEQKNLLAQEVALLRQQMGSVTQPKQSGQVETVDDLIRVMDERLNGKAKEFEEQRLKPLEQKIQTQNFDNNVDRYFANPEKAAVRDQMDAYTATMDEEDRAHLMARVAKGDMRRLNEIYHQVRSEAQGNTQAQAQAQANATAKVATQANPYRVIRDGQQSIQDLKQNAIQSGNFKSVFEALAPKTKI